MLVLRREALAIHCFRLVLLRFLTLGTFRRLPPEIFRRPQKSQGLAWVSVKSEMQTAVWNLYAVAVPYIILF
jgi:hypothetical protein